MYYQILILVVLFSSCNTKSDCREEIAKRKEYQRINDSLLVVIDKKNEELFDYRILESFRKDKLKKQYSLKEAKDHILDYYSFYRADYKCKDIKVRRKSGNLFFVSLKEKYIDNSGFTTYSWNSKVLRLSINKDGTYDVNF